MTRNRRSTSGDTDRRWEPTPAGSLLLAWGGHRERDGILQSRLYRTWDGRYLVYEQQHDAAVIPSVQARVTCRELERDAARKVYAALHVHTVPEAQAFDA